MARYVASRWLRPILVVTLAALFVALPTRAADLEIKTPQTASEARLKKDVTFLASPECEGRGPTTLGLVLAGDHIANEFKKAGLKPGNPDGTYFQNFAIAGTVLDAPAVFTLKGPQGRELNLQQGVHFHPMGLGGAGKVEGAKAVFAGYGRTYPVNYKGVIGDKEVVLDNYDDFGGIDVKGKVVFVINDTPGGIRDPKGGRGASYMAGMLRPKIAAATKAGAAALVFVHNLDTAKTGDDLYDFGFTAVGSRDKDIPTLPVLHIHRAVLEVLLAGSPHPDLDVIERNIDKSLDPQSFEMPDWTVNLEVKMHWGKEEIKLRNVIGVLDGKGPLADETVVVGAHYDHLGYGGAGGSLGNLRKMAIHPGADDNGSGSTSVMELARRFGARPDREGRRLVFMTFSGEELGLLGSAYYCKNPLIPLDKTVAMLNLDMVGRVAVTKVKTWYLPDTIKDKLVVEGLGTAKEFADLIESMNKKYDFVLSKKNVVIPYSDHASFYEKAVPALFLWNDTHENYHRPSDTADRINVAGMRHVVDLAEDILVTFTTGKKPEYVKMAPGGTNRPSNGPTLGFAPGYAEDVEGVAIKAVSEGRPAAKAGLMAGDRIVELAGKPTKDLAAYMQVMAQQKKGETIDVVIVRDGKKMAVKVKLD